MCLIEDAEGFCHRVRYFGMRTAMRALYTVAIIEMLLSSAGISSSIATFFYLSHKWPLNKDGSLWPLISRRRYFAMVQGQELDFLNKTWAVGCFCYSILNICLALFLLRAAKYRSGWRVRVWIAVQCCMEFFKIIFILLLLVVGSDFWVGLVLIMSLPYKWFILWSMNGFVADLEASQAAAYAFRLSPFGPIFQTTPI